MTKPTKAQERLVARVRSKGPLVQDNTEDGARFFLAQGGGVHPVTARRCIAAGMLRPTNDGLFRDGPTQTFTA